jgi:uncharacterized protein (DUF427 family)
MGLSWQQGPLSPGANGRFLVPEALPKRLLYAEPLRRRMRVRFGGRWIADSEGVLQLFEPRRYPVAYFPETDVAPGTLERTDHTTRHPDLGLTSWYTVRAGERSAPRGAWQHSDLPAQARELEARVAFAWPAMDAFYDARGAASSYREAYSQVGRISGFVSFEPDIVSVLLDGRRLRLEPGQTVMPHGPDRELTVEEALPRAQA